MGQNSITRNWCRKKVFTCYIKKDFILVYFSVNTGNIFFISINIIFGFTEKSVFMGKHNEYLSWVYGVARKICHEGH